MSQVSLQELIAGAKAGQVVSFPTDTVPALATLPHCASLIFEAKNRSLDKPLILMGAVPQDLWPFCQGTPEEELIWQQVAAKHWPGMLTLVLPASPAVPQALNPQNPTSIGLRIPNSAIAKTILAQTGPLATTSANRSGHPVLHNLTEIAAEFPQVLTLKGDEFNPENSPSGIPSTVARWTGKDWEILRQGAVKL
ncbi:MAG: L-threonylcarbamoyladenylate synthase [Roseofilum sp. SID2]|uniref:L-threonylcarbamoyladenylate synthase n=1 Tax=unclassified Roseofilum TaxID=2620099 RepID=UPI001B28927D|nr:MULTISPECIES: L-threonylcarbamoyladenylate synthase [unclassified Roseofilum]MBP0012557.1 L-threonylcarbamoyladenylate synthase [Roseofilum sp. SID3]MBP0024267.1 L-threonylcarbamoyladenylate synthase [Roseofilum sp. SID2]MBP0040174.1 L-threonylcarbamoyladenylate synthase [Roseofilum sp. SID1]